MSTVLVFDFMAYHDVLYANSNFTKHIPLNVLFSSW